MIYFRRQTSTNTAYSNVDIDSVDISIRVAMVRFFLSNDVLANLTEHSRTLRLYPRPVVFFQINSFLKSRPNQSIFTDQLSRTQAVDYFAEWALTPNNVVFQRIQTGVYDPLMIGDKLKWYANTLEPIVCTVWQENCSIKYLMNVDTGLNRPCSKFGNINLDNVNLIRKKNLDFPNPGTTEDGLKPDSDGGDTSSSDDEGLSNNPDEFKVTNDRIGIYLYHAFALHTRDVNI